MPPFDHFDFIAQYYDHFAGKRKPDELIDLAGLPVQGPILDIGGGTGRVSQALVGMGSQVVLVDISEGMLQQAAKKDGLRTACASSCQLPFPPETFDVVIMVDAFHHVTDQKTTIDELWRILKVNGKIIVEEPDINHMAVKLIALMEKVLLMHSNFIPAESIAGMFPQHQADTQVITNGIISRVVARKLSG